MLIEREKKYTEEKLKREAIEKALNKLENENNIMENA